MILRPYQSECIDSVCSFLLMGDKQRGLVVLPTACLTGDTAIGLNRAGKGFSTTLRDAFIAQRDPRRNNSIPTMVRAFLGDHVGLHQAEGISYSGRREVWHLLLQDGTHLRGTPDHRIMTESGYVELGCLRPGQNVLCSRPALKDQRKERVFYKQVQGLRFHRFANHAQALRSGSSRKPEGRMYRVALHRLVVEANLNGLPLAELIEICRRDPMGARDLFLLDPEVFAVHHRDENRANNEISNLAVLTHKQHQEHHGDASHFGDGRVAYVKVDTTHRAGVEDTFDITCSDPFHNFIANGIVVHNSGKTVVFSELPKYFSGQTLVLAHRRELIKQAAKKLQSANPTLRVEIEMANDRAHHEADVIVASVQTIASTKRRERLKKGEFGLVIVDEAHHCAEDNGYHTILKDLGVFDTEGPKLLGVTATPYRTGGESLAAFFEGVAYEKPLLEMIEEGWVSPLSAFAVRTHTSLDKVGTRGGDFKENELSDAVDNETRNLEIVRAWQHLGKKRRSTLVFAVDVEHAKHLQATFKAADVQAELVLGTTPDSERESLFPRFVAGEFPVLVNVGVATEGTDLPPVDCILLARPTKSSLLITQMCGRGLRLWCPHGCANKKCDHPDSKQDCVIIDMVDNTSRHKIATSATVLGLPGNVNARGRDLREVRKAFREFVTDHPEVDVSEAKEITIEWMANKRREIRDLIARSKTTVNAKPINLLGAPDASVKKISNLSWIKAHDGSLRLRIPPSKMNGRSEWIEVTKDAADHWWTRLPGQAIARGPFPKVDKALIAADAHVRENYGDRMKLLDGSASWLRDPASPAQCQLIRKLGGSVPERLTKGQAKQMIDSLKIGREERADGPCSPKQGWRLRQLGYDPDTISWKKANEIITQWRQGSSA